MKFKHAKHLTSLTIATGLLLVALAGSELVTGIGLNETYTLLYPEAIILDNDLLHRARYELLEMEVNEETLALEDGSREALIRAEAAHRNLKESYKNEGDYGTAGSSSSARCR